MTTISLQVPDSLHRMVGDIVKREGMSMEQFVWLAMAEKASAIATESYLEERARRGSKTKFLAAMAKVATSFSLWEILQTSKTYQQQLSHQKIHATYLKIAINEKPKASLKPYFWHPRNRIQQFAFPKIIDRYLADNSLYLNL